MIPTIPTAKDMDPSQIQDPEIYIESRPKDPRYSLTVGKWMIIPLKLTIIYIYIYMFLLYI